MAYVMKEKNGSYSIRGSRPDGREFRWRGFTNKRLADRLAGKIDEIRVELKTTGLSPESKLWISSMQEQAPEVYDKLADLGFVGQRPMVHTIASLIDDYTGHGTVLDETRAGYVKVARNLIEFFGADTDITTITTDHADDYAEWLSTAPLNRLLKKPIPYATGTVLRRISETKSFFHYARKKGWITINPFEFLESGTAISREGMEYVELLTFNAAIASLRPRDLKWKLLWTFGRYAGVRGPSELYQMEWSDVHADEKDGNNWIAIRACKNKRHGRLFRRVPLAPQLQACLKEWRSQQAPSETMVFPGMPKNRNFSARTLKLVARSGVAGWRGRWYDLRRSFCCDLLEAVSDITAYEQVTDHSYEIARQHYQILHRGRELRTTVSVMDMWASAPMPENTIANASQDGRKRVRQVVEKESVQCNADLRNMKQESLQPLIIHDFTASNASLCASLHTPGGVEGGLLVDDELEAG